MTLEMTTCTVFVEPVPDKAGWGAWSPDLGVYATGDSRDEAITRVRGAIVFHVEALAGTGTAPPPPAATAVDVAISA